MNWRDLFRGNGAATTRRVGDLEHPDSKGLRLVISPTYAAHVASDIDFFSPDGMREIYRLYRGGGSEVERVTRDTAFTAAAYLYVALRWRSRKVAEAPPMIVREDRESGVQEWLSDHPLAFLLDEPSPDLDFGELMELTQLYVDLSGSALWTKDVNLLGGVGRLTPFGGDEFRVRASARRMYGSFEIDAARGRPEEHAPEEVIYFREVNPYHWHAGVSLVDVALGWLNLGQQARASTHDILENALFPSLVVMADKDWQPDDPTYDKWKQELEAYARRENKGKPLALLGGGTATRVGMTLRDLIPGDILDRVESVVASVTGVPAVVLQYQIGLENSPWSQMSEARRSAYEDVIEPLWRGYERRLTRQLLWAPPRRGARPVESDRSVLIRFDTSGVRALQVDRERGSRIASATSDIGTLNERRALLGWEPSDDPRADEIPALRESAPSLEEGLPLDEFVNPFAEPEEPEEGEDVEGAGDGGAGGESASRRSLDRSLAWRTFDLATKNALEAWEESLTNELAAQRDEIVQLAELHLADAGERERRGARAPAGRKQGGDAFQEELFGWLARRGVPRTRAVTYPLVLSTGASGVRAAATQIGVGFRVLQPGLLDYAATETRFLASVMGETTGAAVASTVQEGLAAGETIKDLVKRLRELPEFTRDRARLVARTETTRAWNGAQRRSLEQYQTTSGTRIVKEWLSARDERVRPEHEELDGERRAIDEVFSNGLMEPGEPNCRCTLVYETEET